MYILNRFYTEKTWSTKRLFKLKSLVQRLRSVPSDCSSDLVHLPHFVSLEIGDKTVDCIKFAARYYVIDYTQLTAIVAGLVCQHQSAFFQRFSSQIDQISKLIAEEGATSQEVTIALGRCTPTTFDSPVKDIPDDILTSRWKSLMEASWCVADMRNLNKY